MFNKKIETISFREFLGRGHHIEKKKSPLKLYGFMGLDMTSHSFFSPIDFNMPYIIVFGVAGVVILSTIIENVLIAYGNPRKAEMVESLTKLIMPIGFYVFLAFGIFKVFL